MHHRRDRRRFFHHTCGELLASSRKLLSCNNVLRSGHQISGIPREAASNRDTESIDREALLSAGLDPDNPAEWVTQWTMHLLLASHRKGA